MEDNIDDIKSDVIIPHSPEKRKSSLDRHRKILKHYNNEINNYGYIINEYDSDKISDNTEIIPDLEEILPKKRKRKRKRKDRINYIDYEYTNLWRELTPNTSIKASETFNKMRQHWIKVANNIENNRLNIKYVTDNVGNNTISFRDFKELNKRVKKEPSRLRVLRRDQEKRWFKNYKQRYGFTIEDYKDSNYKKPKITLFGKVYIGREYVSSTKNINDDVGSLVGTTYLKDQNRESLDVVGSIRGSDDESIKSKESVQSKSSVLTQISEGSQLKSIDEDNEVDFEREQVSMRDMTMIDIMDRNDNDGSKMISSGIATTMDLNNLDITMNDDIIVNERELTGNIENNFSENMDVRDMVSDVITQSISNKTKSIHSSIASTK